MGTNDEGKNECVYNGSGKIPLLCAAGAFFALAIAMVVEHTFMLISVSNSSSSSLLLNLNPDSGFAKNFAWQAGFFFIATWTAFAVGEILLLIGLSVESGHLKKWGEPRASCVILGQGLFTAAGIFGLVTVFLAAGLYITALRAERILQDQENVRQQVLEASVLYASPPRSPRAARPPPQPPIIRSASAVSIDNNQHTTLAHYLTQFEKFSTLM